MSSESSSGDNSSSGSSSDGSSSGSRTRSRSRSEQLIARSLNTWDDILAPEHPSGSGLGPLHDDAVEETDIDMAIVEEGEVGETPGPVPTAVKGQSDLSPATYWIGRSSVT